MDSFCKDVSIDMVNMMYSRRVAAEKFDFLACLREFGRIRITVLYFPLVGVGNGIKIIFLDSEEKRRSGETGVCVFFHQ